MNGPGHVNGVGELERQISAHLHGHSRLAPDNNGWERILDRIEQRGRARHRRRVAVTGLVVVGIIGTLGVLTGDDTTRVSTTPAGPDTSEPIPAAGGLPRLVLDVPGFELIHASSTAGDEPWPDLGPLAVYGTAGEGLLGPGPVLIARLVPPGAAYGIGDGAGVQDVDVAGRPGRIITTGASLSLGWPRRDGSIVHLLTMGLADVDIVAAGQAIEVALSTGQALPASLPGSIELLRQTAADTAPSAQSEVFYRSGTHSVGLRLFTGGAYRLDDLVRDRLGSSSSWRETTVAGRPAVLSTYDSRSAALSPEVALMWSIADGVVAELTAARLSDAEIEAIASSIRPIDEASWQALVARSDALATLPDPAQVAQGDAVGDLTTEMCQARNGWLKARAAGDPAVAAASVADLQAVLAKGEADGLGLTGDTLVVAERLLEAMAAGDEAAVSSIPKGGACS